MILSFSYTIVDCGLDIGLKAHKNNVGKLHLHVYYTTAGIVHTMTNENCIAASSLCSESID